MPAYEYTALSSSGKPEHGVLEGDNAKVVRQLLRERNLTPLEVNETNERDVVSGKKNSFTRSRGKISNNDLALLTRQLATLMKSGSTLEEALGTTAKQTPKNRVKSIILSVRSKVVEGHTLETAMADHGKSFSELYRATISAGEQSGHLEEVLEELSDFLESRDEFNQVIMEAMIYPIIIVVVAFGILAFLLTYIVPVMTQVFENNNQALPFITQIVVGASDLIKSYGLLVGLCIGVIVFGGRYLLKRDIEKRKRFHAFLLGRWILGDLLKGINAARFTRTLSILVSSSVPILDAMRISAQVVPSLPIREAIEKATQRVREGTPIYKALNNSDYFPIVTLQLIASGETSGTLENMLLRAAIYQEKQTTRFVKKFLAFLSPMAVLAMGGMVLFIVLSIMLPILNMNQMVH